MNGQTFLTGIPDQILKSWKGRIGWILTAVILFFTAGLLNDLSSRNKPENSKKDLTQPKSDEEKRAESLKNLQKDLIFGSTRVRIESIGRVSKLRDEEKEEFLLLVKKAATEDRDPQVRKASLAELRKLKSPEYYSLFINSLTDPSEDVQTEAVRAISDLNIKEAGPHLLEKAKARDFRTPDQFLITLINALGKLQYSQDWEFFKEKAEDPFTDAEVRQFLLLYFGKVKAVQAAPFLLEKALEKSSPVTDRSYAVNSLGQLDYKESAADLRKMLSEIEALPAGQEKISNAPLRMQIITALVRLGDESVEPMLKAAAMDDNDGVRLRAVKQIGEMKLKSQRELVEYMAERDRHPKVRKEARRALEILDGKAESETGDADEKTMQTD